MNTRFFAAAAAAGAIAGFGGRPAAAQVEAFPSAFRIQRIATNGTTLYVSVTRLPPEPPLP